MSKNKKIIAVDEAGFTGLNFARDLCDENITFLHPLQGGSALRDEGHE